MTTLTSTKVATLLKQMFDEIEPLDEAIRAQFESLTDEQYQNLQFDMADYKTFYSRMKDAPLAVSRTTAILLYMLARASKASSIIEFGTSFGLSTIHLAAALRDNGGGRLIGTEFEPNKIGRALRALKDAELDDLVEIRPGDALQTLSSNLPDVIDMVLLDGAKHLYLDVMLLLKPRLKVGAIIVADNAEMSPAYLTLVRSIENGYLSVPLGEDVELTITI